MGVFSEFFFFEEYGGRIDDGSWIHGGSGMQARILFFVPLKGWKS
jgi:hypothetical protein